MLEATLRSSCDLLRLEDDRQAASTRAWYKGFRV